MGAAVQWDRCYEGLKLAIPDAIKKHQDTVVGFEPQGGPFQLRITYEKNSATLHGPRAATLFQKGLGDAPYYDHKAAIAVIEHAVDPKVFTWDKEIDLQHSHPCERPELANQLQPMREMLGRISIEKTFSHPLYKTCMPERIFKQGRITLTNYLKEPFVTKITISGRPQLKSQTSLPLMFQRQTWALTNLRIENVEVTQASGKLPHNFEETLVWDLIRAVGKS